MFDVVYSNHLQKSSIPLLIFYEKIENFVWKTDQLELLAYRNC